MTQKIRQPIITVAGHVDHGKTTLLDNIRKSCVASQEAGGITQKISFTLVPIDIIQKRCPLIQEKKINLEIPGVLFIDTPGHAAFSHLRKRGGSLADLAIVVIDINEGIMPQTAEVIEILKMNKTPFLVALNKIDNISGWRKLSDNLKENIELQAENVKLNFDEKLFTIIGALHHHGFNAKPFYEITDFSTQLALVPCSAKTGEGIAEILMVLCGLSQKYLKKNLYLGKDARGVILEIKKEKSIQYLEAILYDGILDIKDEIAIGTFDEPIITKIRTLEEILPLSNKFKFTKEVIAATGIRIQLVDNIEILPGMPFRVFKNNLEEIKNEFKKEIGDKIKTDCEGIIVKADSLGSLEALIKLLKMENIKIVSAGIGPINKKDIMCAQANLNINPLDAIIVGFNVEEDEEVKNLEKGKIKIIKNDVIYRLIEDLLKQRKEIEEKIKKEKLMELATLGKLKILHQYVFRNSNPAIFGVLIEKGKIKPNIPLIDENGKEIGNIKSIQENQNNLNEATQGMEVAISIPGVNYDRQLSEIQFLYTDITENQFKKFKENKEFLTREELEVLQKIAEIKRIKNPSWGI